MDSSDRFDILEKKIITLHQTMQDLSGVVYKIHNVLYKIKDDRNFEEKRGTSIDEISETDKLYRILSQTYPGLMKSNMKYFNGPLKKEAPITDFDGLLILDRTTPDSVDTMAKLIVIEAKTTLNKNKIDIKIEQIFRIHNLIKSIKANNLVLKQTTESFRSMICNYNVTSYPSDIFIIFAPKIVSNATRNYLFAINEGGMTEEKYIQCCVTFLKEEVFDKIVNDIKYNTTLQQLIKDIQKPHLTPQEYNTLLAQISSEKIIQKYKKNISEYDYIPRIYTSLKPSFDYFQNKLGLFFNDVLESPFHVIATTLGGERKLNKTLRIKK